MAHLLPTASALKARYPEFSSVADDRVSLFLADAASYVSQDWDAEDYRMGALAAAAHLMALEGEPRQAGRPVTVATMAGVKRRRVGSVETEFNVAAPSASSGITAELSSSPYGRVLLRLVRLNGAGVRVV